MFISFAPKTFRRFFIDFYESSYLRLWFPRMFCQRKVSNIHMIHIQMYSFIDDSMKPQWSVQYLLYPKCMKPHRNLQRQVSLCTMSVFSAWPTFAGVMWLSSKIIILSFKSRTGSPETISLPSVRPSAKSGSCNNSKSTYNTFIKL